MPLARITAVPKNVMAATMLAGEPIAIPLIPCPEVQPPAVRAPNPMMAPANKRISPSPNTPTEGSAAPTYDNDGENVPSVAA
jgi:hypothetical protein